MTRVFRFVGKLLTTRARGAGVRRMAEGGQVMCANRCWGDDIIALSELLPEMDADDVEMLALKLRKAGWKSPSLQAPTMVFNITSAGLDAEAVASVALENIDYAMRRG